jgi:signal transduction histidine kinase
MVMPAMDKNQLELVGLIHDLRNPLTAIVGHAQVLRLLLDRDGGGRNASFEGAVSEILVSASRMSTMLEDMLADSRSGIEGGSAATSLAAVLNLAVEQVEQAMGQRRVHLVQPARPISGPWDRAKVARALVNVLENALKYSPDGAPVLVTAYEDGVEVEVTIQDQGIGIPAAELPLLFNGFVRASNVRERFAGTGLGLASSRQLVESQGGSLEIASVEDCGTTVTITLPL